MPFLNLKPKRALVPILLLGIILRPSPTIIAQLFLNLNIPRAPKPTENMSLSKPIDAYGPNAKTLPIGNAKSTPTDPEQLKYK